MKIENISPYFWDSFLNEFVRFLTSRYGKDPANAKRYMTNNLALGLSVMSVYGYALYQRSTLEKSILNKYFSHVPL